MTKTELEEYKLREKVAYHAFLYEVKFDSPMSDYEWDILARKVDVTKSCGNIDLDMWYKTNYSADTGHWIWSYPLLYSFKEKYNSNT